MSRKGRHPNSLANLNKGRTGLRPQPNVVRDAMNKLKEMNLEPVRPFDVKRVFMQLVGCKQEDLTALALDEQMPMYVRIVAKELLSKRGFEILEKVLDRTIGRPTQSINTNSEVVVKDFNIKDVLKFEGDTEDVSYEEL